LLLLFGILFLGGPSVLSSLFPGFDLIMVIIGLLLAVGGSIVFTGTIREKRRIIKAIKGRDEVSLDSISTEVNIPYERTKEYLTNLVNAGFLKGRIVDDMYVVSMTAERIDSRTVRCPHCDTVIELPEDI
jgi:predicted transcriptional regulator